MILGCCCGGCAPAPVPVPEFENVTRVTGGVAPYARPWYYCNLGSCVPEDCDVPGAACHSQGYDLTVPLNRWNVPGILDCEADGAAMVSKIADNCYRSTGAEVSFPSHCSYGWKGVQSKAVWPGMFGFVNSGGPCCPTGGQQQSKYTSIKIKEIAYFYHTSTTSDRCDGLPGVQVENYYRSECEQTAIVDSYGNVRRTGSGGISITIWNKQGGVKDPGNIEGSCYLPDAVGFISTGGTLGVPVSAGVIPAAVAGFTAECGTIYWRRNPATFISDYTGTAAELNVMGLFAPLADTTQGTDPAHLDILNYTTIPEGENYAARWDCSDNKLSMSFRTSKNIVRLRNCTYDAFHVADRVDATTTIEYSQEITLGGDDGAGVIPYESVIQDAKTLLDEWPLNDDTVYPWRTDAQTWLQPFVRRDAASTSPNIAWGTDENCAFVDDVYYSGEIRGTPLPAGYGRHFNFFHINWLACTDGGACGACEESLGAFSASPLPATATQWTDKFDGASQYGPGGHLSGLLTYEYGDDTLFNPDEVRAQKWAETLEEWPSVNHSRPCERDRYLYNEAAVACIVSFVAPDLEINVSPAVEFAVNDIVVLNDGGVYTIATKTDAQNYTVGAKLYDSPLPCDGASKLRFPSARAICSSIAATAEQTSPGLITVTTAAKHWLRGGGASKDTVTFTGIGGLTAAEATVVDDTSFTVSGTLTSSPDSGTVSHGATSAQIAFDTTCPRHDFIYSEWQSNGRQFAEESEDDPTVLPDFLTETQHTIAPIRRHPTVLCISPNSRDTFPHGLTVGFGNIEADQCYGEEWHARFNQAENDPFWQADHVPCGHGSTWTQAEQPCTTGADEYEYPPLVEPRLTAPSGAPTIPVTLHTEPARPNPVSHPNCDIEPYQSPTPHYVRAAWLLCDDWREKVNDNC